MKIDVVILAIEITIVIVYQSLIKSNVLDKKMITSIDITIYDETFATQTQLINVVEFYSNL